MFFLWLVIAVAVFDGAQMNQYIPLSLPHFCICDKSNIMKIIPRRMCIYKSSNGSAYMSDCLSEVDKAFNMCRRNRVSCYHIKFDLQLKMNESRSSALKFLRDTKNPARTLIRRKNSTNPLDDGYMKRFTIMAKVFSTLFEDRLETFDLMSLISELKEDKNESKKPNFYFLILKAKSNKFLTISEARNLTNTKLTKTGVLMSTAMTDVGFTFNGTELSFFDEDFWGLVKDQFELRDDLKAIAAEEGIDLFEDEDKKGRRKDQVPLGEDVEGMTGQRENGLLNGKKRYSDVKRNRSKSRTAGGRKQRPRKTKPDLIFLVSMGTDLPTNMSDLELKNKTGVSEKHEQQQDLKATPVGNAEKGQVIIDDSDLVENEINDDIITPRRNAVRDEPPRFRRKLLQYERINVYSGKDSIKNGTEIKSRQKRQDYPHNSWCTIPTLILNANVKCKIWSYKKVCTLSCLDGYLLHGKSKVETCCTRNKHKEMKWNPDLKACEVDSSKDKASKDKASKDTASKDKTSKDKASKDKASIDTASKDKTSKDTASKDKTSKDKASKDKASKDTTSKEYDQVHASPLPGADDDNEYPSVDLFPEEKEDTAQGLEAGDNTDYDDDDIDDLYHEWDEGQEDEDPLPEEE